MILSKPPYDCGIAKTSLYLKVGKYPKTCTTHGPTSGEIWMAQKCRKLGIKKRIISCIPNLIQIFDNKTRNGQVYGKYKPPPHKNQYYVKPLTLEQLLKIEDRLLIQKMVFADEYFS